MDNVFTVNTLAEVDFLLALMPVQPGDRLLDIGYGTGRHSLELARRGYRMTGVDISAGMLARAQEAAAAEGLQVAWIQQDAIQFKADDPLEHDLTILANIQDALKPGALFVLTASNGLRKIREYDREDVVKGRFDPLTLTDWYTMTAGDVRVEVRERGYVPSELILALRLSGFETLHI